MIIVEDDTDFGKEVSKTVQLDCFLEKLIVDNINVS